MANLVIPSWAAPRIYSVSESADASRPQSSRELKGNTVLAAIFGVIMSIRVVLALAAALALGGCMTTAVNTPSGSPEATVRGAKPDKVRTAIMNAALNRGLRMKSDSANMLVFERPTTNVAADILLSTRAGGSPADRMRFTLVEIPEGTRVVAFASYVSNTFEQGDSGRSAPVFNEELGAILAEVSTAAGAAQQARR